MNKSEAIEKLKAIDAEIVSKYEEFDKLLAKVLRKVNGLEIGDKYKVGKFSVTIEKGVLEHNRLFGVSKNGKKRFGVMGDKFYTWSTLK